MAALPASTDDAIVKKRREMIRELEKLRREYIKTEKECRLQVFHRKEDLESIDSDSKKFCSERESELKKILTQLTTTKQNVRKFRESIRTKKPSEPFLNELKAKMVDIESSISSFKSRQKSVYDELLREELQCVQEIASLEKKMASWEKRDRLGSAPPSKGQRSASKVNSVADSAQSLPPAVAAFEKFLLQTGGASGDWNEEDHAIFLRVRHKHRSATPAFFDEVLPLLVPRGREDVQHHEDWFQEFSRLIEEKKRAIDEWKEQRLLKRKEECNSYQKTEEAEMESSRRKERQRREADQKGKLKREADLTTWKVDKELERQKQEEEKQRRHQQEKEREEKERARKVQVKAKAEEFAVEKRAAKEKRRKEEEKRSEEGKAERQKTANEEILKFQERDQMTVAQRLMFNQMKIEEEKEKEAKAKKIRDAIMTSIPRDASRLTKPTKGVEGRRKAREEEEEERGKTGGGRNMANFNLGRIPSRATPSWRAGV